MLFLISTVKLNELRNDAEITAFRKVHKTMRTWKFINVLWEAQ